MALLGLFSTIQWSITATPANLPPTFADLSAVDRVTFAHEFGHLLHYFTTYLGLTDLLPWARVLAVLSSRATPGQTEEAHVTAQAAEVLTLARQQQLLQIDDFYYYEVRPVVANEARSAERGRWAWGETTGKLFRTDGTLSGPNILGLAILPRSS